MSGEREIERVHFLKKKKYIYIEKDNIK